MLEKIQVPDVNRCAEIDDKLNQMDLQELQILKEDNQYQQDIIQTMQSMKKFRTQCDEISTEVYKQAKNNV